MAVCSMLKAACPTSLSFGASLGNAHPTVQRQQRIPSRQFIGVRAAQISSNDFRPGTSIELDGTPFRVQEFLHVKPGKGAAFVRTKLKNYVTGNTMDRTFRAGEMVEEAYVEKKVKQFTYNDGDQLVFMDMESYDESRLSSADVGDGIKFLKEGMDCNVLMWNNKCLGVELPINVTLKVTMSEPGVKGNTASGSATKPVTVETGATVDVPLFVNTDDSIIVDSRTGQYVSRA